jgi:hypothetical protein
MSELLKMTAAFRALLNMVLTLTMILFFSVYVVTKHLVRFSPSQEHSSRACSSFDHSIS